MFLNHDLSSSRISLLPEKEWQKCFDEKKPIGFLLGEEVSLWVDSINPEWIVLGYFPSVSGSREFGEIPNAEKVASWFEDELKREAEVLSRLAKTVENIRLYGTPYPPAPPVLPSWQNGSAEPAFE